MWWFWIEFWNISLTINWANRILFEPWNHFALIQPSWILNNLIILNSVITFLSKLSKLETCKRPEFYQWNIELKREREVVLKVQQKPFSSKFRKQLHRTGNRNRVLYCKFFYKVYNCLPSNDTAITVKLGRSVKINTVNWQDIINLVLYPIRNCPDIRFKLSSRWFNLKIKEGKIWGKSSIFLM